MFLSPFAVMQLAQREVLHRSSTLQKPAGHRSSRRHPYKYKNWYIMHFQDGSCNVCPVLKKHATAMNRDTVHFTSSLSRTVPQTLQALQTMNTDANIYLFQNILFFRPQNFLILVANDHL